MAAVPVTIGAAMEVVESCRFISVTGPEAVSLAPCMEAELSLND